MRRLAIIGAGGHGRVAAEVAEQTGWSEIVFFDDRWPEVNVNGQWIVRGNLQRLFKRLDDFQGVFVAIGDNQERGKKIRWLSDLRVSAITLVSPHSIMSKYASLGAGTIVMPGAVMNFSSTAGQGVILNTGCSVDHDCTIGDYAHISPGARLCGGVSVGKYSWVGVGAAVTQQLSVGDGVVIGAGAAVVSNVLDGQTVLGVPAKPK
jgi:sugar O-acyltransferase (sialic acid O-acetyltransferase NeuD family)